MLRYYVSTIKLFSLKQATDCFGEMVSKIVNIGHYRQIYGWELQGFLLVGKKRQSYFEVANISIGFWLKKVLPRQIFCRPLSRFLGTIFTIGATDMVEPR
jgi:hypothetical protein